MSDNELLLPGDHISSAEEAVAGDNAYMENDEIYAAAMGEANRSEGTASVDVKRHALVAPYIGMKVYFLVQRTSLNKARGVCVPVDETEGKIRSVEFEASLSASKIRKGYVKDIRDEVKIGDIVKAEIINISETDVELSIFRSEYGLMAVFCPNCRTKMDLKDNLFICGQCKWKERRKTPLQK
jgi:exosome complex RNA-binding protein Csl4